jgi:hypothetical protein
MPDHFRNFSEGYNDWLDRAEVFEAFAHGKMSYQDVQKWRAKKGHHSIDDVVPVLDQSGDFFKLLNPLNDSEKENGRKYSPFIERNGRFFLARGRAHTITF